MNEPRCELTEMVASECSHCTGRRGYETPEELPRRSSVAFPAQFAGLCRHCNRPFDEGAQIVRSDEVEGYCLLDHTRPRLV